MRRRWEVSVRAGVVNCARCGQLIEAGALWDLGHVDGDRTRWSGPAHRACNRATLGRYGHVPGVARRLAYLEAKVPYGIVRCGRCGWRIRKGSGWRVVVTGRSTSCVSTSRVRLARQAVWMGRGCGRRTGAQGPTTSGAQQTLRREGRRPTWFRFILSLRRKVTAREPPRDLGVGDPRWDVAGRLRRPRRTAGLRFVARRSEHGRMHHQSVRRRACIRTASSSRRCRRS